MIRLAVIGADGRWGTNIVKTLAGLPNVVVAARGGRTDWQAALDTAGLDGAIIATPPSAHAEQAVFALERGLPVFVEKPLALSVFDAEAIAAAAGDLPILVDHTQLFHSAYAELRTLLQDEQITRVDSIGGGPGPIREGYSSLWDYGPHDVALALDLLGIEPGEVKASIAPRDSAAPEGSATFHIALQWASDQYARIYTGSGMAVKRRQLQVRTQSGVWVVDDLDKAPLRLNRAPLPLSDWENPLTVALQVFLAAIAGQPDRRLGLDLAIQTVKILENCEAQIGRHFSRQEGVSVLGST